MTAVTIISPALACVTSSVINPTPSQIATTASCRLRIARYASVVGCAPECAATHWLNRNGRGVDWHSCQRGGVVSGVMRRERTRERNAEWVALYRQGLSMRQIAGLWGVAPSTVSRALREVLKKTGEDLSAPMETGELSRPPAYAHTRSAPLDHVRAVQRRLNRLSRGRGLRFEPAGMPAPPPLALAARCAPARLPWPPAPRCTPVRPRPRLGPPVGNGRDAARLQGRARHLVESKTTRGLWVIPPVWAKLWEIRVRLAFQQK